MKLVVVACLLALSAGTVFFSEEFGSGWESRWVQSSKPEFGKFELSAGKWFVDEVVDKGIRTPTNAKSYAISSKFPAFTNDGKTLVVQFTVKNEQNLDCGGGYIKILPEGFDQANFDGQTPYLIMFGPDQCGSDKKTHVILPYNGKNFINTKRIRNEPDNLTHQYTLIVNPDNTFKVLIDNQEVTSGSLEENFEMLPPKEINDPSAKKPDDWIDNPTVPDVNDFKPEGWDDIPEFVDDVEASKPDDWNDDDGEWKAPRKRNPEYKGEWRQKTIPNPDYKGPWVAPKIANPDYAADSELYKIGKAGGVGIEIWQVTPGSIFDNFFIGDNVEEASEFSKKTFAARKENEPAIKKAIDDEESAKYAQEHAHEEEDYGDYEDIEAREDL